MGVEIKHVSHKETHIQVQNEERRRGAESRGKVRKRWNDNREPVADRRGQNEAKHFSLQIAAVCVLFTHMDKHTLI